MKVYILNFLLLIMNAVTDDLAQNSYPDVIKCGNYFFYIGFSSPALSRYYALVQLGTQIQSYQMINGVIKNKQGTQVSHNCVDQKVETLWNSNRAFRIQNQGQLPQKSVINARNLPDAIKCDNKILITHFYNLTPGNKVIFYHHSQDLTYKTGGMFSTPQQTGINCQRKELDQLKTDGKVYYFVTEEVAAKGQSIYSITGKYPDVIKCDSQAILYISAISDDQSSVVYRGMYQAANDMNQIIFKNDIYSRGGGNQIDDCKSKSLDTLISEGKAYNLNYPVLLCPNDITAAGPVVNFIISASPTLTVVSSHASGSGFPHGTTTTVMVRATHSSGLNLQCTFGVTLQADNLAPTVACPNNIEQLDPIVNYEATATDNSIFPIKITYDKDSGSFFKTGSTTVKVTATDAAGNQAFCTFGVNILPDTLAPIITCPKTIGQENSIVNFKATATDNVSLPVKITYDQGPGSKFKTGKTIVRATATDAAGNQAFCTFDINIIEKEQSSSGSPIGIIIGSVIALIIILAVVVVICMKKKKIGCFKVKERRAKRYQFPQRNSVQHNDNRTQSSKRLK